MALIDTVKPRIGVYYSEMYKDIEVQQMIDGAIAKFAGGGWIIDPSAPTADAIEAIILYCKMAQSTDPASMTEHPVLISAVANGKIKPLTCIIPVATPAAGTYFTAQRIELTTKTPSARIIYTLDGTTPNDDSEIYRGAISVTATTTVKAIARRADHYDSPVLTATYTLEA